MDTNGNLFTWTKLNYLFNPYPPGLNSDPHTHAPCALLHSVCTVCPATVLNDHAQISPISILFGVSYHPVGGTGSVMASQSSCELVPVNASSTCNGPRQPAQEG